MKKLDVQNLSFSRGGIELVSGLCFSLCQGEWLHLKGQNGSGKSTLMRTLAGAASPTSGKVVWTTPSDDALTPGVVMMGHQIALKREFTPRENLRFGVPGAARLPGAGQIQQVLARVGLAERADLPVRFFSEGQKRRLLLARLLIQPATLWLLDEPVNGLDDDGVALLGSLVEDHLGAGGMAVITSHQPLPLNGGKALCL